MNNDSPTTGLHRPPVSPALEDDLREALRMGPGGLDDRRREAVLDAALALTEEGEPGRQAPGAPAWSRSARPSPLVALAAAACLALGALVALRWIPSRGNQPGVAGADDARPLTVRFLPPTPAASGPGLAVSRLPGPPATRGFVSAQLAHVTELSPNPGWHSFEQVRRILRQDGKLPEPGSVAVEEMVNYFPYAHTAPPAGEAVSLDVEVGPCPWAPGHQLARVGLKAWGLDGGGPAARDVRLAVDFNPRWVASFRLIGYADNRADGATGGQAVPAGTDLAAGQSATALYEVVPVAPSSPVTADLVRASVRYRLPDPATGPGRWLAATARPKAGSGPSTDFRFASAVAACGLLLNREPGLESFGFPQVLDLARASVGEDADGRRAEFVGLVKQAALLAGTR